MYHARDGGYVEGDDAGYFADIANVILGVCVHACESAERGRMGGSARGREGVWEKGREGLKERVRGIERGGMEGGREGERGREREKSGVKGWMEERR